MVFLSKHKQKIVGICLFISIFLLLLIAYDNGPKINYVDFLKKVESREIEKVKIVDNTLKVITKDGEKLLVENPKSENFKENLLKSGIIVEENHDFIPLIFVCSFMVLVVVSVCFLKLLISATTMGLDDDIVTPTKKNKGIDTTFTETSSTVTFEDVEGIEEAKQQLQEIVDYLKTPEKIINMGIKPPKGIICKGEPGTGKTLLAKAIAGEANVPFYSVSGSDFIQMYVGIGALRIRNLFELARTHPASIIFIDEIDAVGKTRSNGVGSSNDERDQTLNALLTEMDGLDKDNSGIVVIAATNRIDTLDPALLRAGRFDRHLNIELPDVKGRESILKVHSKNKNINEDISFKDIAKKTIGFTGADLENLLNESGWEAIRDNSEVIEIKHIEKAFDTILVGNIKQRNLISDKERRTIATHEVGHALTQYLISQSHIEKITIIRTSNALGYVLRSEDDKVLRTKQSLFNDICVSLGGIIAEKIIYGDENITTGASEDLITATNKAEKMVLNFGMSDEIGLISFNTDSFSAKSSYLDRLRIKEISKVIKSAQEQTETCLRLNIALLEGLTEKILDKKTLTGKEFEEEMNKISSENKL